MFASDLDSDLNAQDFLCNITTSCLFYPPSQYAQSSCKYYYWWTTVGRFPLISCYLANPNLAVSTLQTCQRTDKQTDRQTRSSQYSAPVAARTTMRRGVRFLSRRPRGDDTSTSSIFRTPRQDAAGHCPCSQRWPRSASPPSFLSSATAVLSPAQLRAAAAAAAAAAAEATGCAICHLCRRASRRRRGAEPG